MRSFPRAPASFKRLESEPAYLRGQMRPRASFCKCESNATSVIAMLSHQLSSFDTMFECILVPWIVGKRNTPRHPRACPGDDGSGVCAPPFNDCEYLWHGPS